MSDSGSVDPVVSPEPSVPARRAAGLLRVPLLVDSVALIVGLAVIGLLFDEFTLGLLTAYVALALMAIGMDLIWGYTGILSFGQAGFFGLGAYGVGLTATRWASAGTAVAICLGLVAAVALALLLGWFVFYSRVGVFFIAVITLAVSVVLEQAVNQFSTFTGGLNGINLETAFPWAPRQTYFFVVLALAVVLGLAIRLVRSDFGQVLLAIRDNEERARFLGFATPWVKTMVFALSAVLCAAGGLLYVLQTGLVSPTLIGFTLSTQAVIWTAIGGRGTLVGPALGAIAINYGQHELSGLFLASWQLALGVVLVMVVVFAPDGLYARFVALTRRGQKREDGGRQLVVAARPAAVETGPPNEKVLSLRGLSRSFGSYHALSDVSFDMARGQLIGLIGPNGAGKSTLVDVVTGRREPSAGHVTLLGQNAGGRRPEVLAGSGLARTFQAGMVFDSVTVFDNLFLAARRGRLRGRDCVRRSRSLELPAHLVELLAESGLDHQLDELAGELAHGDRKWLELCMVLAQEPSVVLLDEPTAGLTQAERRRIGDALRATASHHGLSLLLIEHDLEFVRQIADRIIVLEQGRVALDGGTQEVVESPLVREIYLGVT
jgi:branched-chain amino acid transport system permease protein